MPARPIAQASQTVVDEACPLENGATIRDEVSRDVVHNPGETDAPNLTDEVVLAAFRLAIATTDADVGLLHRRTDAYLYTVDVHQLDPNYHLHVGLSLWDPAVRWVLRNLTVEGGVQGGEEEMAVGRRLDGSGEVLFVLAIPVMIGDCIEAVIELGRKDSPFSIGSARHVVRSIQALVA
jgi:hypothetical protein